MLTEEAKKLKNAGITREFKSSELKTFDPEKGEYVDAKPAPSLTELYAKDKNAFVDALKKADKDSVSAIIKTLDKQGLELVIKELFGKDIDRRKSVVSLRIQAETFLENL